MDLIKHHLYRIIVALIFVLIGGCAMNLPDLTVELYDIPNSQIKGISPYPPLLDQPVILSVLVENDGNADITDGFITKLYVDEELVKTWTFPSEAEKKDLGSKTKILLKPGSTRIYDDEQKFSTAGKHRFRWVVDVNNNITESDEKNNILDTTLVWQAAPDLIVKNIWPVVSSVGGQKLVWKIEIKNIGKGDAKTPFLTTFWPEVAGGSQENFWTNSLAAAMSDTLTTTQWFQEWGKKKISATVDATYSVAEVLPNGEKNNEFTNIFDLKYVDLKIDKVVISPSKTIAYVPVNYSFTVKNSGTGDATESFKIRIFPGKVSKSGTIEPEFITVAGLKAGASTTLKHSVKLPPGKYQAIIEADAFKPNAVYFEPNRLNNVWYKELVCPGMRNGHLFTLTAQISPAEMETFIKNDPELDSFREKVALTAIAEMKIKPKLGGDKARDRYDASGNWCSEFVAWIYRQSGMKNIKYCSAQFIFCWNNVYLDEVTLTKELVKLFDKNGNRFKWRTKNQVKPQTANVGDFVARTSKEKKKNHSALVVAVSQDYKYMWTAEGNVSDSLWFGRRDYFKDGKSCAINIDGIGMLDKDLF